MGTEEIKSNIRRMFNILNSQELSSVDELVTEDVTYRATSGEQVQGIEEFKQFANTYYDAFDDLEFDLEELFVQGNKAMVLYRQRGTHTGELLGIEASNNEMDLLICSIGTFDDDGKFVDVFDIFDTLELMRQLDAIPEELSELTSGLSSGQRGR